MKTIHKYWKTAALRSTGSLVDGMWMTISGYALRLLRVVVLLSIWRTVISDDGVVSGMSMEALLTYTLISEACAELFSGRTGLEAALWEGNIAKYLLRPMGVYGQFISHGAGEWLVNFCLFSVPLLLLGAFLGVRVLPSDFFTLGWFVLSVALAMGVATAVDFVFTALMVLLEHSVYAIQKVRSAVSIFLSGAVLPLAMFPWNIGEVFEWLPFASMASAPLRIYTATGDVVTLVLTQAIWAAVLWFMAHGLWRINRERLACHGG